MILNFGGAWEDKVGYTLGYSVMYSQCGQRQSAVVYCVQLRGIAVIVHTLLQYTAYRYYRMHTVTVQTVNSGAEHTARYCLIHSLFMVWYVQSVALNVGSNVVVQLVVHTVIYSTQSVTGQCVQSVAEGLIQSVDWA